MFELLTFNTVWIYYCIFAILLKLSRFHTCAGPKNPLNHLILGLLNAADLAFRGNSLNDHDTRSS